MGKVDHTGVSRTESLARIRRIILNPDPLPNVHQWANSQPTRHFEIYTVREGDDPTSHALGCIYVNIDLISVIEVLPTGLGGLHTSLKVIQDINDLEEH